jgi:hypothetical protein
LFSVAAERRKPLCFFYLQQDAIKNQNEICEAAKNKTFASFARLGEEDLLKLCS